jgi:beta-phosphoglucomutase family hydrolase
MTNKKITINPKAKGLIFDLDGTIADTMPAHYIAWRNALKPYGIDFPIDVFESMAGMPRLATVERLNEMYGTNMDAKEVSDLKEIEFEKTLVSAKVVEPVFDVIKEYHGKLPMAVGTGGCRHIATQTMKLLGIDQYIDILVSSDDISNPKPHPETFLKCAEHIGVDPVDCEVFEDAKLGIDAAKSAGMMWIDVTEYYEVTIGE